MTAYAQQSRPSAPLSGRSFQSPDTQRLEADEGANPGLLWLEQGRTHWATIPQGAAKACADCHGPADTALQAVAARYPAVDSATGRLLNIERRINQCRTEHQRTAALASESPELLSLATLVAWQSRGVPRRVDTEGAAKPYFEAGRAFYSARQGQLNLACGQCHDDNVGRKLRGDTISQGQTDGWPGYRLEWQTVGSLARRLRACSLGVRAEVLDYDAPEYLAVELYLAWRGDGMPLSAPGVRR